MLERHSCGKHNEAQPFKKLSPLIKGDVNYLCAHVNNLFITFVHSLTVLYVYRFYLAFDPFEAFQNVHTFKKCVRYWPFNVYCCDENWFLYRAGELRTSGRSWFYFWGYCDNFVLHNINSLYEAYSKSKGCLLCFVVGSSPWELHEYSVICRLFTKTLKSLFWFSACLANKKGFENHYPRLQFEFCVQNISSRVVPSLWTHSNERRKG